ncbi:DUF1893 domain-containing protein [Patescibacteria group bacterium]|nr:DUF1893 domain-containing protein [Patescibacteria group bacterium]MBU1890391.1 DUF1893 domain-containing protein [Patescibacteria group bacterium]
MTKTKAELQEFRDCPWSIYVTKSKKLIYRSNMGGINPLLQALNQLGEEIAGSELFDKVVGRAAAFLAVYGGIRRVNTPVISIAALEILRERKIPVSYLERVDRILDREKKELCPMEKLSLDADTPEQFVKLIKRNNVNIF